MRATNADVILVSKANAGMPEWHGADLHYSGSPDVMAAHAHRQRAAGIQIIGACCGSSPAHLAMMRQVLDGDIEPPEVEFEVAVKRMVVKPRERTGRRGGNPAGASY
jgi:Homocysteine S-methyltransferase